MTESKEKVSVLFVCMGNICRSPTALGVFRHQVDESGLGEKILSDSAGTHAYHVGHPPDRRAQAAALMRGYDLSELRARRIDRDDFYRFDHIIVMDRDNLEALEHIRPDDAETRVELFLRYARRARIDEVPDPYYGGAKGFEYVLDLVEDASSGLLEATRSKLSPKARP